MARGYNRLPLAAALLATATSASAAGGIVAGDWTLDIGGIVNAYYTSTKHSGVASGAYTAGANQNGQSRQSNITTGLLPNYLVVSGKTRQNDLDVGFTVSIQPGTSNNNSLSYGSGQENRQAFFTFGDASWGSVKMGKDIGVFASDAILNDMTLLGVGSAAGPLRGNSTTLGRIGSGFIYADFKPQISYTTPNMNGFSATAAITQGWDSKVDVGFAGAVGATGKTGSTPGFEGKASYDWTGDVAGKVWVSGISQKIDGITAGSTSQTANAYDIGATASTAGFGLTAYASKGEGIGHQYQFRGGLSADGAKRDSDSYFVQATYVLPTKTKIGVSYGESNLDMNASDNLGNLTTDMWVVGAYHPLTKHLNLVAEYSDTSDSKAAHGSTAAAESKSRTVSLGGILFF